LQKSILKGTKGKEVKTLDSRLETRQRDRRFDLKSNLDESTTTYSKHTFLNILVHSSHKRGNRYSSNGRGWKH